MPKLNFVSRNLWNDGCFEYETYLLPNDLLLEALDYLENYRIEINKKCNYNRNIEQFFPITYPTVLEEALRRNLIRIINQEELV